MRQSAAQAIAWAREGGREWIRDKKSVAAVAQVGELSRRLSTETKAAHPDVPWAAISSMRNRIYHDYGALDVSALAETVRKDLPGLARQLEAIVGAASKTRGPAELLRGADNSGRGTIT